MFKRIIPILLITATLIFPSCKKSPQKTATFAEQVFIYNAPTDPEYLDPTLATDVYSLEIAGNLFEGLTDFDPKDSTPLPGVAKNWEVTPDGKTYIFNLRKDAKWSDGTPVTAQDFVYSWRRAVNPETAAQYAYMLYFIKNAEAINGGKIKDLSQLGITAIDDYTLKVELENPTPFFPSIVAFHTLRPVKKDVVEKFGRQWTRPQNMVNNGPFNLKEWVPLKQVVLEANPQYWDKKNVLLKKAIYQIIEDQETALKNFKNGNAHYLAKLPAIKIPSLRNNSDFIDGAQLGTFYLTLETKKPPLDNPLVRQALNYAIDREQLVKVINMGIASSSFTPDNTAGYNPPKGLDFNPEKARQLLKEAGYGDAKPFPVLTISYDTNETYKMIMEIVQNMWKKNLGIDVKLFNMEFKTLLKALSTHDFEIARTRWIGDYVDPNTFLALFITNSGNNHTNWGTAEYDQLIKKAGATVDQEERYKHFSQAEKLLLEEAPIVPLFTLTHPIMLSQNVEGFYPNLLEVHPLKGVRVKGAK